MKRTARSWSKRELIEDHGHIFMINEDFRLPQKYENIILRQFDGRIVLIIILFLKDLLFEYLILAEL